MAVGQVLDPQGQRQTVVHKTMLQGSIHRERGGNLTLLILTHLEVVEILMDIGRIEQQAGVLALAAKQVLLVELSAEIAHQVRHVGYT